VLTYTYIRATGFGNFKKMTVPDYIHSDIKLTKSRNVYICIMEKKKKKKIKR